MRVFCENRFYLWLTVQFLRNFWRTYAIKRLEKYRDQAFGIFCRAMIRRFWRVLEFYFLLLINHFFSVNRTAIHGWKVVVTLRGKSINLLNNLSDSLCSLLLIFIRLLVTLSIHDIALVVMVWAKNFTENGFFWHVVNMSILVNLFLTTSSLSSLLGLYHLCGIRSQRLLRRLLRWRCGLVLNCTRERGNQQMLVVVVRKLGHQTHTWLVYFHLLPRHHGFHHAAIFGVS